MKFKFYLIITIIIVIAFATLSVSDSRMNFVDSISTNDESTSLIDTNGMTIQSRILLPKGYRRVNVGDRSYGKYLRDLPLKKPNAEVEYYSGDIKKNNNVYCAVIDLDIGKKNLHQCADAVMRLRAEYLWKNKRYNEIHFNLTNGFRVDYSDWRRGKRIEVNGNRTNWIQKTTPSNTYKDFWNYMELVFMYAGTLSLSKELKPVNVTDMKIGDVFIQGGSPGHAVVVVDLVKDEGTNEKLFLLAQSYMPAQEIQILINPNNTNISPWYSSEFDSILNTPEWTFYINQLMRFDEE